MTRPRWDGLLSVMARSPQKTAPLVRSTVVLRAAATAITLSSFAGMSAFAATHVQNVNAPLKPATTTVAAVATAVPTTRTTRRTTVTSGVTTTTRAATAKTHSS